MLKQRLALGPSNVPPAGSREGNSDAAGKSVHQDLCETKENAGRVHNGFRWTFPNIERIILDAGAVFGGF